MSIVMDGSVIAILVIIACVLLMMSLSVSVGAAIYSSGSGTSSGTSSDTASTSPLSAILAPVAAASGAAASSAGGATGGFAGALSSGPSACRVPGNRDYTGYDYNKEPDIAKCRDKCLKDSRCNAFESNGEECWYYGGAEVQTPFEPGTKNQCYVRTAPAQDRFAGPLASGPSACRVPGNTEYTGYDYNREPDIAKCRDKCLKDSRCKAFESNGAECWYYGGAEVQSPFLAGTKNQCYVRK